MKIILASNNPGKLKELQSLLSGLNIQLINQKEMGVDEIEETGLSFVENALIKARHAAKLTSLPAIADDSGLSVPALGGLPGIYSARYASHNQNSEKNIEKLLNEMTLFEGSDRDAMFHCVLVLMLHPKDPVPLIAEGHWHGTIAHKKIGSNGFGYDPIFYLPNKNKTAAELSASGKNKMSHRGMAMRDFLKKIPEKLKQRDET